MLLSLFWSRHPVPRSPGLTAAGIKIHIKRRSANFCHRPENRTEPRKLCRHKFFVPAHSFTLPLHLLRSLTLPLSLSLSCSLMCLVIWLSCLMQLKFNCNRAKVSYKQNPNKFLSHSGTQVPHALTELPRPLLLNAN